MRLARERIRQAEEREALAEKSARRVQFCGGGLVTTTRPVSLSQNVTLNVASLPSQLYQLNGSGNQVFDVPSYITRLRVIADFHDLRREFASRVRETPGHSDHEVRDQSGHASITTTSRYLGSTPETLERAVRNFEKHQGGTMPGQAASAVQPEDCHTDAECDNPAASISASQEVRQMVEGERVN